MTTEFIPTKRFLVTTRYEVQFPATGPERDALARELLYEETEGLRGDVVGRSTDDVTDPELALWLSYKADVGAHLRYAEEIDRLATTKE